MLSNLLAAHIIAKQATQHHKDMITDMSADGSFSVGELANVVNEKNIARYVDEQDEEYRAETLNDVGSYWLGKHGVCNNEDWDLICEYAAEIVAFELNSSFNISFGEK